MKITKITVRKLVSGPGFNNHAIEAESEVRDFEDADEVYERTLEWVERHFTLRTEMAVLRETRDDLREEVRQLETTRDNLKGELLTLQASDPRQPEIPF